MDKLVSVELRLNNSVFECAIEKKFYNARERKPYAIMKIVGVMPHPQNPQQVLINPESIIICEQCYNDNKEDKGLHLKDPSNVVTPSNEIIQKLSLKKN